jgi:hypothetical protein
MGELDAKKNATSGDESKKSYKYIYLDQLLFLLRHLEDRDTYRKLGTERN